MGVVHLTWTSDHLLYLLRRVQEGADYDDSVQQVWGNPVGSDDVLCPSGEQKLLIINIAFCLLSRKITRDAQPDQALSPVGGKHHDGGDAALQRSMEIREAFGVQHVHLIHKQHPGYQLGDTLVNVTVHHLVDLSTELVCSQ